MKKSANRFLGVGMLAFAGIVSVFIASSSTAVGAVFKPCFQGQCLDVWNPVLCPNGHVYSNACYAARACQYNCGAY